MREKARVEPRRRARREQGGGERRERREGTSEKWRIGRGRAFLGKRERGREKTERTGDERGNSR